jgi:hypothetical protein
LPGWFVTDSEHVQGIVEFLKSLGAARIAAMAAVTVALVGFSPSRRCASPIADDAAVYRSLLR